MSGSDRSSRQLAVLLFTDLVDSTALRQRLGERAADELRTLIDELQTDLVTTNGGQVVKHTGDGIMAAFGSVTAALGCSAGLHIEIARLGTGMAVPLAMRVGVAAGEVTSDNADFFGMPVVLASRLCDACAEGEVLVSDLTRSLILGDTTVAFDDPQEMELKGIDGVTVAWHLRWLSSEPLPELPAALRRDERFRFVGRSDELAELTDCWRRARNGEQHVALLSGSPGIGKTRLVAEFANLARADGATVLFGRNDESLSVPYEPFAEAFEQYVDEQPTWSLGRRLGASRGDLVRLLPELGDRVSGLPAPVRSDAETERFRLFEAVAQWLSTASAIAPIVLVLDDLQWAASQTVQLIRHLALSSAPMSLLIVGTVRDSGLEAASAASSLQLPSERLTRLNLAGFDEGTILALLEAAAGHSLGHDAVRLAELLHAQTGGNPFFCRELLLHLVETGALGNVDGRWQLVVDFGSIGIPDSLRTTVTDRVARLSEAGRQSLQWASIIGLEIDVALLESVVELSEDELLRALEECVGAGVLEELGADQFQFTHALARSTLYESLGTTRRLRLHRRVAESLEEQLNNGRPVRLGDLAHHFAAGARDDELSQAIDYCRRAADQAMQQLAYDEAERLYRRATELLQRIPASVGFDSDARCQLLTDLATAAMRAGDPQFETLFATATDAALELDDPARLAEVLLAGSRGAASATGTVQVERVALLRTALDRLPVSDDPTRARLLANLATELQFTNDVDAVMRIGEQALSMARRLGDAETLVYVLTQRVSAIRLSETLDEQLADLVELGRLGRDLGDPQSEFFASYRSADVYLQLGDLAGFEQSLEVVRRLCPQLGQRGLELRMIRLEEEGAWLRGDLDDAEQHCDAMLSLPRELGAERQIVASHNGSLAKVLAARGRSESAISLYEYLANFSEVPAFSAGLAVMLEQSGEVVRARELYETLMQADLSTLSMNLTRVHNLCFLASLCSTFGDADRAEMIEIELVKYRHLWVTCGSNSYGPVTHFLARLADLQGRGDDAQELFADADARCLAMRAPLLRAWNQIAWAESCARRGIEDDVARAQGMLDEVIEMAIEFAAPGIEHAAAAARSEVGRQSEVV